MLCNEYYPMTPFFTVPLFSLVLSLVPCKSKGAQKLMYVYLEYEIHTMILLSIKDIFEVVMAEMRDLGLNG